MPFLPDETSTDRLLKYLAIDLMQQFGAGDLNKFGWFQYREHDHPETLVSSELAADAFLYLSSDADGSWRRNPKVVTAVVAFMGRYYDRTVKQQDLMSLKKLIDARPLDRNAIKGWFYRIYPPSPVLR